MKIFNQSFTKLKKKKLALIMIIPASSPSWGCYNDQWNKKCCPSERNPCKKRVQRGSACFPGWAKVSLCEQAQLPIESSWTAFGSYYLGLGMGLRSHPSSAEGSSQIGEQIICFQKLNPGFLHENVLNPLSEFSVALGLYNSIFFKLMWSPLTSSEIKEATVRRWKSVMLKFLRLIHK